MLERLYRFLDKKIVAIENELGAIKSFRPFALSSILQALNLFVIEILKSLIAILILLTKDPKKSFEVLRTPAPAYSYATHEVYRKRIRIFSFYGLGSVITAVVIISLVLNLITPASQIPSYAQTFSTTWTSQGDFESNTVTSQGATTRTNVDTTSTAGSVKLSTVGADQTFTETFTGTTNIDTANSADSASGVSGGQLALATGTATNLSAQLDPFKNVHTDAFTRADNTDISVGTSFIWTERSGNWEILTNQLNLNTATAINVARTPTISVADYTVQAIVNSASTAAAEGVVGRRVDYGTDDSNGYFLSIIPGTGLKLHKRVSGVWTELGSYATTINTATNYTVKLKLESSTITGFLDDVQRISVADTSLTAAGDAGIKAESASFKADDFTVDQLSYTGTQTALARASNGDVYVGAGSGKFGRFNASSNTFTDLTSKISSFWSTDGVTAITVDTTNGAVYLVADGGYRFAKYTIATDTVTDLRSKINSIGESDQYSLAFDSVNNTVYIGGGSGKFVRYNVAADTATDLTSKISSFWSTNRIRAMVFDSGTQAVYFGGGANKFAKYTVGTDTAADLTAKLTAASVWNGTYEIHSMTIDTVSSTRAIYVGAANDRFAKCNIGSNECSDNAATGVVATNLTSKLPVNGNNNSALTFDSANSIVYVGGGGTLVKYTIATDTGTDLTSKISGFWNGNVNSLSFDSTNSLIYICGQNGGFAKLTAVGTTQSVQSNAVDSLATNIAYATLTKNDTPGTGSITYQLSNNGTGFNTVTPGTRYDFTTNGSSLKWKITLTGNATVQDITIVYNGYTATGTITNLKQDAGGDAVWSTISWNATTPTGTSVKFRTRGATAAQGSGALGTAAWSPYYTTSGATITDSSSVANPTFRYLEIEMYLDSATTAGTATPTITDFTPTYVINAAPELTSITASQSSSDGSVTVNFSVRDTDTNTGTTNPGRVNLSLEYCTNAPTCSTWTAASTVTGDVGLKQVCDGSGSSGGLNCALTQYTAYSITWTPATDYANQYSSGYKIRVRANDNEGAFNNGYGQSAAFEFDTKAPALGSPSIKIDGANKTLTLSVTDDNAQTPQIQMQFAKTCGALTGTWITYAGTYDATSIIGSDNPVTICGQFRDYFKNTTATVSVSTLAAPANLLLQDTTNKDISQYQMFLSWGVVASASKYHIYRSTDGFATRTEVGTITSPSAPNTNYYTDSNFSTNSAAANYWNKTYAYRVTAEDSDTDESIYSATKSGTPDGTTQAEEGGGTITVVGRKALDVTAPVLSSVNVKDITPETAKITWATDEISDSTVYYSINKTFSNRQFVNSLVTSHSVELTGLTPNETYYFRVASSDTSGNTGSDDNKGSGYTFKTLVKDADPPKIFNVSIVSSATSAKISWETDEDATSYADYTLNTNKDYDKTAGSAEFVTKHEIILKELTPQNEYRVRVNSSDKQKNKTISSEFVFTTISLEEQADVLGDLETLLLQEGRTGYEKLSKILAKTSGSLPAPKILGDTPRVEVTPTSAIIRWTTDVPSNSMIALVPDAQYSAAAADPYVMTTGNFDEETLAHEVVIINLAPSTLYHYQLRSKPAFGPEGRSRDLTFQTRSIRPEIFNEGTRKISQNQATIAWSTNVQADSLVRYTPYRNDKPNLAETKLQGAPDLVFDHEITLVGLEYGILYAIELQSTDRLGNVITKNLKPFSTSIDLEAPKVSQIRTESAIVSGAREQVQTIIFWKTDEPSTSQVIYQEGIAENKELERATVEDPGLTQNHVVVITSFKPGSVYRFKVRSRDTYGNTIESSPFTILAPIQKETVFQIILKNFEDTFGWVRRLKL